MAADAAAWIGASLLAAAASGAPLELGGATIGMSLQQWKAAPLPGHISAASRRTCEPARSGPGGSAVQTCSYSARYGEFVLPQALRVNGRVIARRPTYTFVADTLACIEYRASVDAFDRVMARLRASYGAPSRVRRDTVRIAGGPEVPRVRVEWNLSRGTVRLIDPSPDPDRLLVQLAARVSSTSCPGAAG